MRPTTIHSPSDSFEQKDKACTDSSARLPEITSPFKAATSHTTLTPTTDENCCHTKRTKKKKKKKKEPDAQTAARGETFPYHIAAAVIHLIVLGLSCPNKLNSSSTACNITLCWLSCTSITNSFPLSLSPANRSLCYDLPLQRDLDFPKFRQPHVTSSHPAKNSSPRSYPLGLYSLPPVYLWAPYAYGLS